jgi:O-acetyl-ADP-ribose deacetylase (regulator of RNase III)
MDRAAPIAVATIRAALAENPGLELVRFVCYGREAYEVYRDLLAGNK